MFATLFLLIHLFVSAVCQRHSPQVNDSIELKKGRPNNDTLTITLDDAKNIFNKQNLSVIIAQNYLKADETDLIGAQLWNNPNLSFNSTFIGIHNGRFDWSGSQHVLRLDKVFETGGKRGNRIESITSSLRGERKDYENNVFQMVNDLKSTYVSYAYALKIIELEQNNVELFKNLVDAAHKRKEAGDIGLLDEAQLELALFNFQQGIINDQQNLIALDSKLHTALNIPKETPIKLNYVYEPNLKDYSFDSLLQVAFTHRADLTSQEIKVITTKSKISLARSNGWPDLDFGVELENIGPDFKTTYGLGIGIAIPLFNRNQDEIGRRDYEYKAATLELELKKKSVTNDVKSAYEQYQKAFEFVKKISGEQLQNNQLVRDLTIQSYNAGNLSVIDLINSEQLYITAIQNYYNLLLSLSLSQIQLESTVGTEIF